MIHGTDTAKYQPLGTYDPGAFEIINAQDPSVLDKIVRNRADGRPWGLYVWVYPGQSGASLVDVAASVIGRAFESPPLGVWWDYEDAGVSEWQLQQAFVEADRRGIKSGYYSNAHTVNHGLFLDRPWWYAAYPGNNDGSFPGLDKMRNPRPVNIWQYTSGGGLDRNVIVDEGWYSSFVGSTEGPDMTPEESKLLQDLHNAIYDPNLGLQKILVNDIPAQFAALRAELEAKIAAIPGGTGAAATHGTWSTD